MKGAEEREAIYLMLGQPTRLINAATSNAQP